MVKKKSGGSKMRERSKQRVKDGPAEPETAKEELEGPDPPQRLQKKIAKKVNFLEKVASSSLAAKSSIKKKRRRKSTGAALGDLSSLADALGAAEGETQRKKQRAKKGLGAGGAKARQLITSKETVRLQQVLAHPQFQKDPLAAIASHLSATLPPAEVPQKPRKNVSGSQKQKLKRQIARLESEMES